MGDQIVIQRFSRISVLFQRSAEFPEAKDRFDIAPGKLAAFDCLISIAGTVLRVFRLGPEAIDLLRFLFIDGIDDLAEVIEEVLSADLIIFSIGSLFTSIIPNLICDNIKIISLKK